MQWNQRRRKARAAAQRPVIWGPLHQDNLFNGLVTVERI